MLKLSWKYTSLSLFLALTVTPCKLFFSSLPYLFSISSTAIPHSLSRVCHMTNVNQLQVKKKWVKARRRGSVFAGVWLLLYIIIDVTIPWRKKILILESLLFKGTVAVTHEGREEVLLITKEKRCDFWNTGDTVSPCEERIQLNRWTSSCWSQLQSVVHLLIVQKICFHFHTNEKIG